MKKHHKHSKSSYGGGSSSSSGGGSSGAFGGYSHIDANPDTIKQKMKDLGDDMQNTLSRIDALEKKVKNKQDKRKKGSSSSSRHYDNMFDDFMGASKSSKHYH